MSTMDSYGVVGDGGGGLQNNNNNQSPELMPNMRLAFSAANGAAVYKPLMPPTSPHSASATPTPSYQPGGNGGAITASPLSINVSAGEQTKRKRGRPKKNNLDETSPPPLQQHHPVDVGLQQPSGFLSPAPVAVSPPGKKQRGRPPGSGRKQPVAAMGSPEAGFTPHVITVKAGEDVSSKIMSVSQSGTQAICILSANGAISNVTLRQAATSGGTVTYEGRFEILSLSGSFMLIESGGQRSRTGGLSVMLAGPDGRVLGGGVAGVLTAAAPVQVVVGCFNADQELKSPNHADLLAAPPKFIPGASSGGSPASRGTLSESSGGPGSPLNQSGGIYNNNNLQGMPSFAWK